MNIINGVKYKNIGTTAVGSTVGGVCIKFYMIKQAGGYSQCSVTLKWKDKTYFFL